jgi:hypothetical protein
MLERSGVGCDNIVPNTRGAATSNIDGDGNWLKRVEGECLDRALGYPTLGCDNPGADSKNASHLALAWLIRSRGRHLLN